MHRAPWLALIALAFVWPRGARAEDAGIDAAAAAGYVDFTEEDGLAGGEELASPSLQPIEHDSLLPDRFRGPVDAGPPPPGPAASRGRGCAGCGAAGRAGSPWLLLVVAIALRRRRAFRFLHET